MALLSRGHARTTRSWSRRTSPIRSTGRTTASIASIRDSSTTAPTSPAPRRRTIFGFGTVVYLTGYTTGSIRAPSSMSRRAPARTRSTQGADHPDLQGYRQLHVVNNTFYDYLNRYNQIQDYYADTAKGSYTLENKTDFKVKFATGSGEARHRRRLHLPLRACARHPELHQRTGERVRSVGNPNTWIFPASDQVAPAAFFPPSPTTRHSTTINTGPRDATPGFVNGTVDSNLQDAAIFLEHRLSSRRSGACCTACAATWCS